MLYFIFTSDPNATQVTTLQGGVGQSGITFNYVAQNKQQMVSLHSLAPGAITELREKTYYMTVARKKSDKRFAILRQAKKLEAGEVWTANDQLGEIFVVDRIHC